jgi:hypothetical protein
MINTQAATNARPDRSSTSSAHHISAINFVHSVRPPSYVETQEQIEQLNDSQRFSQIYSSQLALRNTKGTVQSDYFRNNLAPIS